MSPCQAGELALGGDDDMSQPTRGGAAAHTAPHPPFPSHTPRRLVSRPRAHVTGAGPPVIDIRALPRGANPDKSRVTKPRNSRHRAQDPTLLIVKPVFFSILPYPASYNSHGWG